MVYDESVGDWVRRHGYKSIKQNEEKQNWVMEAKDSDPTDENPFAKLKAEKKLDRAKQKFREMRNKVEGAGFKLDSVGLSNAKDGKSDLSKNGNTSGNTGESNSKS